MDPYALASYSYDLPEELIAQHPCSPRDASRLLIVERGSGNLSEIVFRDLPNLLETGDSLVFNDTKVIPARLMGKRAKGGITEVLLLKNVEGNIWDVLIRPGKKCPPGSWIHFSDLLSCQVLADVEAGVRRVAFECRGDFNALVDAHGAVPLPPYIRSGAAEPEDTHNYQTVYAAKPGAVAAPTAGLHFTQQLLEQLGSKGVGGIHVTLHVSLGTFRPVDAEDIRLHTMHTEVYEITNEAAEQLNCRPENKKQILIGTTSCRVLESACVDGKVIPGCGTTSLFINPGYRFKYAQHLLTNFHLPRSSLLMLVCAFGGYELIMEAYRKAIADKFRFYSYGDAMLIL